MFNRPGHTTTSFERIRAQRPAELFLIADGPRPDHESDPELCQQVRGIVENIDWPCTVHRDFADVNMGCKRRVSSGLSWAFSQVDRAIVLEDDCVPRDEFFPYCEALLERYREDERVAAVTGNNFQDGTNRGDGSYYFSKYNHVWGWASWSRAWRQYDGDIEFWPAWKASAEWRRIHPDPVERRYWEPIIDRVARGEVDTWDYSWTVSSWYHGGLTATPNANLVSNIGFGPGATHTKATQDLPGHETSPLGPLRHPSGVHPDGEADRYTFDHHFGGAAMRQRRRPAGFLRWVGSRGLQRLRPASGNDPSNRSSSRPEPVEVTFSHHIFNLQPHGGVSRYVTELHQALLGLGARSLIVAGLHVSRTLTGVPRVFGAALPQSFPPPVRRAARGSSSRLLESYPRVRRNGCYHLTYYPRLRRRTAKVLAVTVYDMIHERFPDNFAPDDTTSARKRAACNDADVIFAISDSTRRDLLEILGTDPAKVLVTPLAPPRLPIPDGGDGVGGKRPFVLFVGSRLAPYKNFLPLVRGLRSSGLFPEVDLVCFGGGPFSTGETERLDQLSVRASVRSVQGSDLLLAQHYQAASAFVCPSLYEGFGLPVLEAMSFGCPAACADTSCLPEVAGPAAVYFDPVDEEQIGLVTRRLLEDDDLRKSLAIEAERQLGRFSWERTALSTLAGYRDVLPGG